jgi:chromate reductase
VSSENPLTIAAICGSLRKGSYNAAALDIAIEQLPAGTRIQRIDIRDFPPFDGDLLAAGMPPAVSRVSTQLRGADGIVIATPEYNFSIPGVLKNAIDWLSRGDDQPFQMKPVAILSASAGPLGGARVQYDLRKVLLFVNAMVLAKPEVFIGQAASKFADGKCTDEQTRSFIQAQMKALVGWIASVNRMRG